MKALLILMIVLVLSPLSATVFSRIERFSGENAADLLELYHSDDPHHQFLLEVISPNDLAVVTPAYLQTNLDFALQSRELSYCTYDDTIFQHFVLPYRVTQEPIEEWRKQFYETLSPIVREAKTIEEAAILVNLWITEQMTFKQTHGRDQTPLTTIKRGFGRCEESMIIYIAAARAVGIPARPASVPFWNFTDNNHAWVEIWTPEGWKYLGEAENALNRAWFSKTTERATLVTAHAIGNFPSPNVIKQENNVTTLSSIEFYNKSKPCKITIMDEAGHAVANANVFLYALSYGGLFTLSRLESDEFGEVRIPLGEGTVYVTASKDGKFASALFPIMETDSIKLQLTNNSDIKDNLTFHFPIPTENHKEAEKNEVLGDVFYLKRENAHLRRQNRLHNQARSIEFVQFYQQSYWHKIQSEDFEEQNIFLEKCDELAGNSELFLTIFHSYKKQPLQQKILVDIILEWDVKELIEVPDSTSLADIVDIYVNGKIKNSKVVSDSLFREHVVKRLWTSAIPPENGWQGDFYEKIKHLSANRLKKTVQNAVQWVDEQIVVDSAFVFTYFSGSLNPLQMLNMRHIPERYRLVLIKSALKQLGVPLQWKGRIEYFNGSDFVALEESKADDPTEEIMQEVSIRIFADGKQVKPEPFQNFFISKLQDNGEINYTFFEGNHDSLTYNASFRRTAQDVFYLQGAIRNANGDANVLIETITPDASDLILTLTTPKEYLDASLTWHAKTLDNISKAAQKKNANYSILFVLGEEKNEPEERMYLQLQAMKNRFEEKHVHFQVISLRNSNYEFISERVKIDKRLLAEQIAATQFPLVFLLNQENELIFSSKGYSMGIAELLIRKME